MARRFLLAIRGQVLRLDHPWRAPAQLAPWKDAALNHAQRRHDAHSHTLRCSFKRDLSPLDPFTFAIDGNTMVTAERADPCFSPAIAASSRLAGAIEKPRDLRRASGAPTRGSAITYPRAPSSGACRPHSSSVAAECDLRPANAGPVGCSHLRCAR